MQMLLVGWCSQTRQREAAGAASSSSRQAFILGPLVPDEVIEPK